MQWVRQIIFFYRDGFKQMRVGKQLWAIIAIKFFLFFVVLKLFFFPISSKHTFQMTRNEQNLCLNI